jgi:hypothetical protein
MPHYIFRLILMRRSIDPNGLFAKLWTVFTSFLSYLTIVALVTESFMSLRRPWFRAFQGSLDLLNFVDM